MKNATISTIFKATSLPVPSPTAAHIASLSGAQLQIQCLTTLEIIRNIALPATQGLRNSVIAWSPPTALHESRPLSASTPPRHSSRVPTPQSNRILAFDEFITRVYDLRDDKWNAVISNGSGGMGKNIHVEFGASENEVLVWSDYNANVKIWCLETGRAVEIRDPKFVGRDNKGWGFRPSAETRGRNTSSDAGVLALLCRSAGADVLLLLAPNTYSIITRKELPTIDAVGLKWSRDGRWLVIWDAASVGCKLCIFTADGHLYRTIGREHSDESNEWSVDGLGIKSVEWIPGNQWLSVGGWDNRVRILSTKTFSPVMFLDHQSPVDIPNTPVYTELVDGQGNRTYEITVQPATPPGPVLEKNETGLMKHGISIMAFNVDGTLSATRDDSAPSTIWIWDLKSLKPRTVLIQYAPIKSLHWHGSDPTRLLIQSTHDLPVVYLYITESLSAISTSPEANAPPEILHAEGLTSKSTKSIPNKWVSSWLVTSTDKRDTLFLGNQQNYVLVWPGGKDQIPRFQREDEEQFDDSLYDILTGRKPVPRLDGHSFDDEDLDGSTVSSNGRLDDTFRTKRKRTNGTTREQSAFDESGLGEMF